MNLLELSGALQSNKLAKGSSSLTLNLLCEVVMDE